MITHLSSADMVKLALAMIRRHIKTHKLPVKLVMTVHDQIDTICKEEYAQEWAETLTEIMKRAARTVLPSGLLGCDTTITPVWSK